MLARQFLSPSLGGSDQLSSSPISVVALPLLDEDLGPTLLLGDPPAKVITQSEMEKVRAVVYEEAREKASPPSLCSARTLYRFQLVDAPMRPIRLVADNEFVDSDYDDDDDIAVRRDGSSRSPERKRSIKAAHRSAKRRRRSPLLPSNDSHRRPINFDHLLIPLLDVDDKTTSS